MRGFVSIEIANYQFFSLTICTTQIIQNKNLNHFGFGGKSEKKNSFQTKLHPKCNGKDLISCRWTEKQSEQVNNNNNNKKQRKKSSLKLNKSNLRMIWEEQKKKKKVLVLCLKFYFKSSIEQLLYPSRLLFISRSMLQSFKDSLSLFSNFFFSLTFYRNFMMKNSNR